MNTPTGFAALLETPEQEQARLAASPEGSTYHRLSQLPVTIPQWPQDLIIELPWDQTDRNSHRVVVVPIEYRGDTSAVEDAEQPRRRHAGWWTCAVVVSDHPSYPVGGHRLSISAAELARGCLIDLHATMAS